MAGSEHIPMLNFLAVISGVYRHYNKKLFNLNCLYLEAKANADDLIEQAVEER